MPAERGWGRAIYLMGEAARPFSILFLVLVIGGGLLLPWVTVEKITAVGVVFGTLVAARSWENQVQIKATAAVRQAETSITGKPAVAPAVVAEGKPP